MLNYSFFAHVLCLVLLMMPQRFPRLILRSFSLLELPGRVIDRLDYHRGRWLALSRLLHLCPLRTMCQQTKPKSSLFEFRSSFINFSYVDSHWLIIAVSRRLQSVKANIVVFSTFTATVAKWLAQCIQKIITKTRIFKHTILVIQKTFKRIS